MSTRRVGRFRFLSVTFQRSYDSLQVEQPQVPVITFSVVSVCLYHTQATQCPRVPNNQSQIQVI